MLREEFGSDINSLLVQVDGFHFCRGRQLVLGLLYFILLEVEWINIFLRIFLCIHLLFNLLLGICCWPIRRFYPLRARVKKWKRRIKPISLACIDKCRTGKLKIIFSWCNRVHIKFSKVERALYRIFLWELLSSVIHFAELIKNIHNLIQRQIPLNFVIHFGE